MNESRKGEEGGGEGGEEQRGKIDPEELASST